LVATYEENNQVARLRDNYRVATPEENRIEVSLEWPVSLARDTAQY
jgi:hypothetical protein